MPYAKPNDAQSNLFGSNEDWKDEWVGMPEYEQKNFLPEFSIRVNFASYDDMRRFSELIQQTITTKTQSVWYPKQNKESLSNKVYVDENKISDLHRIKGKVGDKAHSRQPDANGSRVQDGC